MVAKSSENEKSGKTVEKVKKISKKAPEVVS
jgi:hypothetical protein